MGFLVKLILVVAASALFLAYSPTLIDFHPRAYTLPIMELTGPLQVNSRLSDGDRLFEGKLLGPESLAVYEGSIYTGTMDGSITKITGNKIDRVVQVNSGCEDSEAAEGETGCSRPLGLRFDKGTLYVADKYIGVYTVNVTTGETTTILSSDTLVGGEKIGFADDLDIDDTGTIYLSDATTRWVASTPAISMIEHENSGRVIKYDQRVKQASVIMDKLYFPNGIQLSKSRDSLLVAESCMNRILRYYLKGPKKSRVEVFAELPGSPDNLRQSKRGYWVALFRYHNPSDPGLLHRWSSYPMLRKITFRLQHAVGSILSYLHQYWKSPEMLHLSQQFREGTNWFLSPDPHGMAVEIDENGKIIQSIQSPDRKHAFLSEILEHQDGYLYAGSFVNPYLIKIKQK